MGRALAAPNAADVEREPLAAFVGDDVTREVIGRIAAERGWPPSCVQSGGVSTAARALAIVDPPRILVVDVADSDDPDADVRALIGMLEREARVIVLGTVNDVAFYRRMLGAGASDYLLKPATPEAFRDALARTEATLSPQSKSGARTILFVGSRGGVGATTVAMNCAWLAANQLQRKVCLVDMDLQLGTVALSLDLDPGTGLRDALSDPDRIDEVFLERAVVKASERFAVLGGEEPLDDAMTIEPQAVRKLVTALGETYDTIFIDMPTRLVVAQPDLLSVASEIVIVCDLSLASLRDVNRVRRFAGAAGIEARQLIVANLVGTRKSGQLAKADFEKGLDGKIDCTIPIDAKSASTAANLGTALASDKRSAATAALSALTTTLVGTTKPAKRSFWRLNRK